MGEDLRQQHGSGGQQQDEANKDRTPPPPPQRLAGSRSRGVRRTTLQRKHNVESQQEVLKVKAKNHRLQETQSSPFLCAIWMLLPFVGSPNTEPTVTINGAVSAG